MTVGGVTTERDIVYVGGLDGRFRAIDSENGREIWTAQEESPLVAPALVVGESVYYGAESGRLSARNALTGALQYAIDLGSPIESAPVTSQGRMLVYLRGHQIVCLDIQTGKIIWNYRRAVPVTVTLQRTTRPLVVDDKVIVGFADGFAGGLSLQEGALLWEQKLVDTQKFVDVDLNPLMVDGMVVTGAPMGELTALDPKDGSVRRNLGVSSLSAPLLRGEQNLIIGTNDGEVIYLSLDGKILKRAKISKKGINHVLWWKDHLVAITLKGELMALDPLTFERVGYYAFGHDQSAVFGDVGLAENGLAVLSSRNRLLYFE